MVVSIYKNTTITKVFMYDDLINQLTEECKIRNITDKTRSIYICHAIKFLEWLNNKPIDEISLLDIREYIIYRRDNGATPGYCNSMCSALSFFYLHILHIPWDLDIVPRMKIDWTLPHILSLEEVEKLFDFSHSLFDTKSVVLISLFQSETLV